MTITRKTRNGFIPYELLFGRIASRVQQEQLYDDKDLIAEYVRSYYCLQIEIL